MPREERQGMEKALELRPQPKPLTPVELSMLSNTAIATMLDPLVAIDDHGTILMAGPSIERVMGWKPEELVGKNIKLLMPEPHRSLHDEYLAHYRKTGHTAILGRTRTFEVIAKDGRQIHVDLSVEKGKLPDGREIYTGTFRDVTERMRAEAALKESERRFHAIFDQTYQFLGLLRPDGTILEINQTALDATGSQREEVYGKHFWEGPWWDYSEDVRRQIRDAVERAASGVFVRFEVEVQTRGGRLLSVDFSMKPMRDEHGKVVLLIPEGRDISEIKRAQKQETAMLRALASVGEQAAVLAHEIKNPITSVNLALRAVADQIGEDQQVILEDLVQRMQRLEQLMRRTLAFAKPLELRREVLDARKLLEESISHIRVELAKGGADARIECEPPQIPFVGDAHHLEEVISNLVRNAVEAKGIGARIHIRACLESHHWLHVTIDDNGPGIPPELRVSLFKPFVTTKRKGTGLGLAIVKKIVEEHGGTIQIDDAPAGGARFVLRLPTGISKP
ncbi:MAG: hypothetical protein RL277_562 [Planctomycetota bacterium]